MRILHWTDNFLPNIGGVETLVHALALAQMEAGHEVWVLTRRHLDRPTEDVWAGVPVWRRPFADDAYATRPRELGAAVKWCLEVRRRLRPDVVHSHVSGASGFYEMLSRSAGDCPVVITPHGLFEGIPQPDLMKRRMLREAAAVTGISMHCARGLERQLGRPGVRLVLNGVQPPAVQPVAAPVGGPAVMLGVGRMVPEKGFDVAVRALTDLPGVRLVLAGDGPVCGALQALAAEIGVADRVDFAGWVRPDAVWDLINRSHLMVMPSRWEEPFGLVAVQAALMERPLVASRVGALPEIVADGETGRLVPAEDPPALAAAVRGLLADPPRMVELGAEARRRAVERFSMQRCAAEYEAVYRAVLSRASR